ncbi:hypothetical protein WBG99_31600 [Streptomyces sp. TG1A-60]|uniref:hypothetical protein n=1 Tax=Streptomyces sp. TG1A-60 TaxID=3129111 RepID=UPI0030CE30A8
MSVPLSRRMMSRATERGALRGRRLHPTDPGGSGGERRLRVGQGSGGIGAGGLALVDRFRHELGGLHGEERAASPAMAIFSWQSVSDHEGPIQAVTTTSGIKPKNVHNILRTAPR